MSDSHDSEDFEIEVAPEHQEREEEATPPAPPSKLISYLRLCRIPNVFTSFSDVAMGYLVTHRSVDSWEQFAALLAASGCLYTSGMVLNDVFDVEKDTQERPHRPIPSGAVSLQQARAMGFGLLVVGVLIASVAGILGEPAMPYRSGVIAVLLAASIVLYDGVIKQTAIAPWMMGGCRFFNVLLGMSLAATADGPTFLFGYESYQLAAAGGIGIYIAGVTWFARTEATASNRVLLGFGLTVMILGLGLLAFIPDLAPKDFPFRLPKSIWPFVLLFLMLAPIRRCFVAIGRPAPERVQAAVKLCILSLIVLDAAIVGLTSPLGWSIAVCALLVPTLLLGRWVYST